MTLYIVFKNTSAICPLYSVFKNTFTVCPLYSVFRTLPPYAHYTVCSKTVLPYAWSVNTIIIITGTGKIGGGCNTVCILVGCVYVWSCVLDVRVTVDSDKFL